MSEFPIGKTKRFLTWGMVAFFCALFAFGVTWAGVWMEYRLLQQIGFFLGAGSVIAGIVIVLAGAISAPFDIAKNLRNLRKRNDTPNV